WFTPTVEVDLCGHATLASAHVLWETDPHADGKPANFETRSGTLTATRRGEGVELDFPADPVTDADPDTGMLDALGVADAEGSDDPRYDFVSRCFGPKFGIDEDPVTGSAHCALGPYWAERFGKTELIGYQASARGGVVLVRVDGDRTALAGRAVTVTRGELVA